MSKRAILITKSIFDVGDDHAVALFVWLIAHANRSNKPYTYRDDGFSVTLGHKQAFLNVSAYARKRGLSRKVVLNRVRQLERRDSIGTAQVQGRGLLITVPNLDFWQDFKTYSSPGDRPEAAPGQQAGQHNHLDNHLDNRVAPARELIDFQTLVVSQFPSTRRTSPAEAEREFRALDIEAQKRCVARVPEWCEFFQTVLLDERQYTPGLHNWIKKRVFDEPRETWETRVKTRKSGGGWSWG